MTDIRDFVLASPSSTTIYDVSSYVVRVDPTNPITTFYVSRTQLIQSGTASTLSAHPILGRLILLGAVSAFENYCRGILAGCLDQCPICQSRSSDKNVALGGVIWHGTGGAFNRSAFENKSFADVKELRSSFREYADLDLSDSLFGDLLKSFDRIMQLRHAIVHSDGLLPGKNAVKLEIDRSHPALLVCVNDVQLQECLALLSSLIETINRELFSAMCRRWAVDWRKRADWKPDRAKSLLDNVFDLFVFKPYNKALPKQRSWGKAALRQALNAQYHL